MIGLLKPHIVNQDSKANLDYNLISPIKDTGEPSLTSLLRLHLDSCL
jgi:hypothetical protein